MYNQPYFIPNFYSSMAAQPMMRGTMSGALRGAGSIAGASRGLGLFSRLGNGLSVIKGVNWGNFITNTSKTLGVINQTIPLVRQVGPMVNNMRSMLRIASIFKDETDKQTDRFNKNASRDVGLNKNYNLKTDQAYSNDHTIYEDNDSSPTFFINS